MDKKKVMIVDDEKDFLAIAKLNLEHTQEYEVKTLSSATNLLPEIHAFKPDVLLLDMVMPGMSGLNACKMLNNDPISKGIPIVIISGLDKDSDKLKAYREGITDYLVKPAGRDALLASIEKALKK